MFFCHKCISPEIVFHDWWDTFMHGSRFFSDPKMCFNLKKKTKKEDVLINILPKQITTIWVLAPTALSLPLKPNKYTLTSCSEFIRFCWRWYSVRDYQELTSMSQGQDWHTKLTLCRVSTKQHTHTHNTSQEYHFILYPSIPS